MRNVKLLSAALLAAATLATPALAATHAARHDDGRVMATMHRDGDSCIRAPRVGAFATEPWSNAAPCEPNTGY
jgi:hypothetical protein